MRRHEPSCSPQPPPGGGLQFACARTHRFARLRAAFGEVFFEPAQCTLARREPARRRPARTTAPQPLLASSHNKIFKLCILCASGECSRKIPVSIQNDYGAKMPRNPSETSLCVLIKIFSNHRSCRCRAADSPGKIRSKVDFFLKTLVFAAGIFITLYFGSGACCLLSVTLYSFQRAVGSCKMLEKQTVKSQVDFWAKKDERRPVRNEKDKKHTKYLFT